MSQTQFIDRGKKVGNMLCWVPLILVEKCKKIDKNEINKQSKLRDEN